MVSGREWRRNASINQILYLFDDKALLVILHVSYDKKKRSPGWFCLKDEFATSWDAKDWEKSIFGEKEITNFDGRCVKCEVSVPISEYICWVARTETLKIRSRVHSQRCNFARGWNLKLWDQINHQWNGVTKKGRVARRKGRTHQVEKDARRVFLSTVEPVQS